MRFDRKVIRYRNNPLLNGLVFWTKFDDQRPDDLMELSGVSYRDSYQLLVTGPTPNLSAAKFVPNNLGVRYNGALNGAGNGDFSVAFWLKDPSVNANVVARATGNQASWVVCMCGSTTGGPTGAFGYRAHPLDWDADMPVNTNFTGAADGKWHHCAVTRRGSASVCIYVDKMLDVETATFHAGTGISSDRLGISRLGDFQAYNLSNSSVADVRVYNRAITAAEVVDIYNYAFRSPEAEIEMPVFPQFGGMRQRHFRFRTDTDAVDAAPTWGGGEDQN